MKKFFIKILRWIIKKLAQLTIAKYRPGIIGITGSVGKTSTKEAAFAVLNSERNVRAARGNLNNDLGLPLAILGNWKEKELNLVSRKQPSGTARARKLIFWIKVIAVSTFNLIFSPRSRYPEVLILEYGADRPGDIRYLLSIARPNMSIITAVGEIPVHVEFYSSPDEIAREKGRLIEHLPVASMAILNADDPTVMKLRERTRAHIATFGFTNGADMRITRLEYQKSDDAPIGMSFKLNYHGNSVPVRLSGVFGKSHAAAAAAAATAGIMFGMNLIKISECLSAYRPAASRMQVLSGIHHTNIIDDSYNASPASTILALDAIKNFPAKRKIAVLGDMLEIGNYSKEAHFSIGERVAKSVDMLIVIGAHSKWIIEGARKTGMQKNKMYLFDTADEAKTPVRNTLKKGDLVLIKGSRGMELEKIVDEIKAPIDKDIAKLLSQYA